MTLLIGDKSRIAVEYSIHNREMFFGCARLWFNNSFIGSFSDPIYLDGYLLGGCYEILSKPMLNDRYSFDNPVKIYESIDDDTRLDDELYGLALSNRINFGTWSDFFDIYSYKLSESTGAILWKLIDTYGDAKDLINYPSCVFYETFNYSDLIEIMDQLNSIKTQQ